MSRARDYPFYTVLLLLSRAVSLTERVLAFYKDIFRAPSGLSRRICSSLQRAIIPWRCLLCLHDSVFIIIIIINDSAAIGQSSRVRKYPRGRTSRGRAKLRESCWRVVHSTAKIRACDGLVKHKTPSRKMPGPVI